MKIILQVMSCDQILYLKLINYLLDELGTSNGGGHSTQNTRTYIQVRIYFSSKYKGLKIYLKDRGGNKGISGFGIILFLLGTFCRNRHVYFSSSF